MLQTMGVDLRQWLGSNQLRDHSSLSSPEHCQGSVNDEKSKKALSSKLKFHVPGPVTSTKAHRHEPHQEHLRLKKSSRSQPTGIPRRLCLFEVRHRPPPKQQEPERKYKEPAQTIPVTDVLFPCSKPSSSTGMPMDGQPFQQEAKSKERRGRLQSVRAPQN